MTSVFCNRNLKCFPKNLPHDTERLYVSFNNISKIENLPLSLKELHIHSNSISRIEGIPSTLKVLEMSSNCISKLENLPSSLTRLDVTNNEISTLENLPERLKYLCINSNRISRIENLPQSLKYIGIFDNYVTKLENLPEGLKELIITSNEISKLENLPSTLEILSVSCNCITKLENLPLGLKKLRNAFNPIEGPKTLEECKVFTHTINKLKDIVIRKIEAVIQQQKLLKLKEINFEELEKRIRKSDVCLDFYRVIKPVLDIKSGEMFSLYIDDVLKYFEYTDRKTFLQNVVEKKLGQEGVFYIERTYKEHKDLQLKQKERYTQYLTGGSTPLLEAPLILKKEPNKRYIYFSQSGLLELCMISTKPKAIQARRFISKVYLICFEMTDYVKDKIIEDVKDIRENNIDGLEAVNNKNKKQTTQLKVELKDAKKQLKQSKDTIETLKNENEENLKIIETMKEKMIKLEKESLEKDAEISKLKKKLKNANSTDFNKDFHQDLSTKTIIELRLMCKDNKIKGYSKFSKQELIEFMKGKF